MSGPVTLEDGFRPLSRAEIEAELLKIDMAPRAEIVRRADQLAGDYPGAHAVCHRQHWQMQ